MKPFLWSKIGLFAAALFFFTIISAHAVQFEFSCITNNKASDCASGEAQLFVDVTAVIGQPNQVGFTFSNVGSSASSITDVYFDDGPLDDGHLLAIAGIHNGPGVEFSQGASPPNLPGGNDTSPPFQTTTGFLADSDAPVQPNGVNPGETFGIVFDLEEEDQTFAVILDDLASGALRIGIHVQGFARGGSESFVNKPNPVNNPNPVPEPATMVFMSTGLLGLAAYRRLCRRKQTA